MNIIRIRLTNGSDFELDLYPNTEMGITYCIYDHTDFGSSVSSFTKTITIPGTNNNNIIFNNYFDVYRTNSNYNINIKIPCVILANDQPVMRGNIKLNRGNNLSSRQTEYEMQIFGEVTDIFTSLGDDLMVGNDDVSKDIRMGIGHTASFSYVNSTIGNTNSNVVYSYMNMDNFDRYGFADIIINSSKPSIWGNKIFNKDYALPNKGFHATLKLEDVLSKMITQAGFTYSGNLLPEGLVNDGISNNLYVLGKTDFSNVMNTNGLTYSLEPSIHYRFAKSYTIRIQYYITGDPNSPQVYPSYLGGIVSIPGQINDSSFITRVRDNSSIYIGPTYLSLNNQSLVGDGNQLPNTYEVMLKTIQYNGVYTNEFGAFARRYTSYPTPDNATDDQNSVRVKWIGPNQGTLDNTLYYVGSDHLKRYQSNLVVTEDDLYNIRIGTYEAEYASLEPKAGWYKLYFNSKIGALITIPNGGSSFALIDRFMKMKINAIMYSTINSGNNGTSPVISFLGQYDSLNYYSNTGANGVANIEFTGTLPIVVNSTTPKSSLYSDIVLASTYFYAKDGSKLGVMFQPNGLNSSSSGGDTIFFGLTPSVPMVPFTGGSTSSNGKYVADSRIQVQYNQPNLYVSPIFNPVGLMTFNCDQTIRIVGSVSFTGLPDNGSKFRFSDIDDDGDYSDMFSEGNSPKWELSDIRNGIVYNYDFVVDIEKGNNRYALNVCFPFNITNANTYNVIVATGSYFKVYTSAGTSNKYLDNNFFLPDIKKVDFLNGILSSFNLVVVPDKNNPKKISLQKHNDYYNYGITTGKRFEDWTEKLHLDTGVSIDPLSNYLGGRYINFTNEKGSDDSNDIYSSLNNDTTYGSTIYTLDNEYLTGYNDVNTGLIQTINKYVDGFVNPNIGITVSFGLVVPDVGVESNPRLLYLNGIMNVGGTVSQPPQTPGDFIGYKLMIDNNFYPMGTYSLFLNKVNKPNGGELSFTGTYSLLNNYTNVLNLYNNSKLITANFWLTPTDIYNLNFNDVIFIELNGIEYRCYINQIKDYNPFDNGLTEVELITC